MPVRRCYAPSRLTGARESCSSSTRTPPVRARDHAALEAAFRERSGLVDAFPGSCARSGRRPAVPRTPFSTAGETREAFREYMSSAEPAASHSGEPRAIMMIGPRRDPEWQA